MTGDAVGSGRLRSLGSTTFRSVRVRNFRLYFIGQTISMAGTFMQAVAQSWLVLKLTGSGTALGLVMLLQYLPMLLLAPMAGVVVERVDRRRLLILTQALAGALALVLWALVASGSVEVWMVYVLAALLGLVSCVDQPARSTFVYDLVGPDDLTNAVGLITALNNTSRATGPAMAGLVISVFGVGPCFLINAISFGAVLVGLLMIRPAELHHVEVQPRQPGQFREGLAYVWHTPDLAGLLFLACIYCGLAWEFEVTLPLMAKFTFDGGAGMYGLLLGAVGFGAILGALGVAHRAEPTMRLVMGSAAVSAVLLIGAALAPGVPLALVGLVAVGITGTTFASSASALLQLRSDRAMRGRVMGLWAVAALGIRPIGGPITGWVGQHIGPRWGLAIGAAVVLLVGLPICWVLHRRALSKTTRSSPAPAAAVTTVAPEPSQVPA